MAHLEPRLRWYYKSTRYQVQYPVENPPKVNRTEPYHAVEKRHKSDPVQEYCVHPVADMRHFVPESS